MIYLLALGSAVLYGAADFTGGLVTRRIATIPVVILSQASGLALLGILLPLLPGASPSSDDLLWGAGAGLSGGVGVALLYRALAIGRMGVVAPTTAVCAVIIPVAASMLLGERPAQLALMGIALGIASILLVSRHEDEPQSGDGPSVSATGRTGLGTAFASGIAIGLFFLTLAQTDSNAGLWPILVARLVAVSLFSSLAIVSRQSLRMPAKLAALAIIGGIIDMLANVLYLVAARQGQLSLVVTLSSLYPASTVILARVVLRERLNLWQVSGVGCALAAIVLIVSGGE